MWVTGYASGGQTRSQSKKVLVNRRPDIEAQQPDELAAWQARSVFGVITELDPRTRKITLEVSSPQKSPEITIDISGAVSYQTFSAGSFASHSGSESRLSVGDLFLAPYHATRFQHFSRGDR